MLSTGHPGDAEPDYPVCHRCGEELIEQPWPQEPRCIVCEPKAGDEPEEQDNFEGRDL
jgi:hypothetical protein